MSPGKRREILIQEELEHRILHGLAYEWEQTLWDLDSSNKNLMRKPLFSLRDIIGLGQHFENLYTS